MAHLTAAKVAAIITAFDRNGVEQNDQIKAALTDALTDIQVDEVTLSAANIIAMNGAPVSLVAAKGAGTVIEFVGATHVFDYGTVQFTGGGAVVIEEETSGTDLSTELAVGVVQAAADSLTSVTAVAATLTANKGLFITNDTAAFAAGDSVMRVKVAYRVHTTGL